MIRLLTVYDLPLASQMGPKFYVEGKVPGEFIPEVFVASWTTLIERGLGFIVGLFKESKLCGCLGAAVTKCLNSGQLIANEQFWFVLPEARGDGLRMVPAYEDEAMKRGAKRCSMALIKNLQPEALGAYYKRRGYVAFEIAYAKELK